MHIFLKESVDVDPDTQSYAVAKYCLMTSENNDLKNLHLVFCGILKKYSRIGIFTYSCLAMSKTKIYLRY